MNSGGGRPGYAPSLGIFPLGLSHRRKSSEARGQGMKAESGFTTAILCTGGWLIFLLHNITLPPLSLFSHIGSCVSGYMDVFSLLHPPSSPAEAPYPLGSVWVPSAGARMARKTIFGNIERA